MTIKPLNMLAAGESGTICGIEAAEEVIGRLAALDLRVGSAVAVVRKARFGGPLHIRIGLLELAVRRSDAARISVSSKAGEARQ